MSDELCSDSRVSPIMEPGSWPLNKLKSLEHLAYSYLIQALRAQGALTKEKKKFLQDVQSVLNIAGSFHKVAIRQAVNCHVLQSIADTIAGPNTSQEWAIEGRRFCPLMPRALPQNDNVALATQIAKAYVAQQAQSAGQAKMGLEIAGDHIRSKGSQGVKCNNATSVPVVEIEDVEPDTLTITIQNTPEELLSKDLDESEKAERKRKRSESFETDNPPCKLVIIDPTPEGFKLQEHVNEEVICMSSPEALVVPGKIALGNVDDISAIQGNISTEIQSTSPSVHIASAKSQSSLTAISCNLSIVTQKLPDIPGKTVTVPSRLPIVSQVDTSIPALTASALQNTSTSLTASVTTPLLSVAASHHQVSTSSAVLDGKEKSKVLPTSKRLIRPKLSRANFNVSSQALLSSTSQRSPLSTYLALASPTCVSSRPANTITAVQVTSVGSSFKRPISPITVLPKLGSNVSSSPRVKSPVTLKYSQANMSGTIPLGTSKSFGVPTTLGTLLSSVVQPQVTPKNIAHGTINTATLKTPNSQVLQSNKISGSVTAPQKLVTTHFPAKSTPIAKKVQLGNEGGLAKPARIVNLSHRFKLDRSRFNVYQPPTTPKTVSNPTAFSTSSSSVTTSSGRPTIPAKPNVIVVHKARVLPQPSGATVLMPMGTRSILSDENSEETRISEEPVKQSLSSSGSNESLFTSSSKGAIYHQPDQSQKEKRLDRRSNIKLPGKAEAITLIERKIPGRLSNSHIKLSTTTSISALPSSSSTNFSLSSQSSMTLSQKNAEAKNSSVPVTKAEPIAVTERKISGNFSSSHVKLPTTSLSTLPSSSFVNFPWSSQTSLTSSKKNAEEVKNHFPVSVMKSAKSEAKQEVYKKIQTCHVKKTSEEMSEKKYPGNLVFSHQKNDKASDSDTLEDATRQQSGDKTEAGCFHKNDV